MAMLAADLRVRTLERASTNDAKGARRMSAVAHGSALVGSKLKPDGLELDALEAAATTELAATSRFSENPPGLLFRRLAQPAQVRPPPAGPLLLDRRAAVRPQRRTARLQRT